MVNCWFCGKKVTGKVQMIWLSQLKPCCQIHLTQSHDELLGQLLAKMDRECPLPDDYIPPRNHHE